MTVVYSLAFAVLVAEIVTFVILAAPVLDAQKAKLVRWVTRQPAFQPMKTMLLVIWFLITVLFLDAFNRAVLNPPGTNEPRGKSPPGVFEAQGAMSLNAKKFYAQRNFYLTGVTLLMSFVVARYYSLLVKALELEHRLRNIQSQASASEVKDREIDDFRRKVNELEEEKKDLAEKLKKAERELAELRAADSAANGAVEEEEPEEKGPRLRKRQ
ncbi:B-cell receptor-associated protein 31-like-domain-containing protein [Hyaloraphidium curvatum]|nr:B-cell receptor-associated protein 31-like-domain-containing protein [Hyaloraphidium curvatum]